MGALARRCAAHSSVCLSRSSLVWLAKFAIPTRERNAKRPVETRYFASAELLMSAISFGIVAAVVELASCDHGTHSRRTGALRAFGEQGYADS